VLVVVLEGEAAQHRQSLAALHGELFNRLHTDPLAPTHLEVIDRATEEAIQRLMAAGLIAKTTRAARALFPAGSNGTEPPPLSAKEREKAGAHRAGALRKLKMARLLGDGGLGDEARASLLEAMHALGRALAVEHQFPEPATLDDVLLPPISHCWREALPLLRNFVANPTHPWQPVCQSLAGYQVEMSQRYS